MRREKFNQSNKAAVRWDDLLAGMEALADEYEESGWRTLVLHPGDVSTTVGQSDDEEVSFRLVVPESELDALAEMVDEGSYEEFEVHRGPDAELSLFVVTVKDDTRERAVVYPVYYDPDADRQFVAAARDRDTIYTDVTNLNRSRQFSFAHDKPSLFFP